MGIVFNFIFIIQWREIRFFHLNNFRYVWIELVTKVELYNSLFYLLTGKNVCLERKETESNLKKKKEIINQYLDMRKILRTLKWKIREFLIFFKWFCWVLPKIFQHVIPFFLEILKWIIHFFFNVNGYSYCKRTNRLK